MEVTRREAIAGAAVALGVPVKLQAKEVAASRETLLVFETDAKLTDADLRQIYNQIIHLFKKQGVTSPFIVMHGGMKLNTAGPYSMTTELGDYKQTVTFATKQELDDYMESRS